MPSDEMLIRHCGACHCGAVSFEATAPAHLVVYECNCSICSLSHYLHLIVPANRFRLVRGRDELVEYRFNTGIARHLFCKNCGVKSFYVPRSNPDGVSINACCLDPRTVTAIDAHPFDGRNWEASAAALSELSKPSGGGYEKADHAGEAAEPDD